MVEAGQGLRRHHRKDVVFDVVVHIPVKEAQDRAEVDCPSCQAVVLDVVTQARVLGHRAHLEDRVAYFRALQTDLKPSGRVAILELRGVSWFSKQFGHFTDRETIVAELEEAGYRVAASHDFVEEQTFTIFERE